MRSKVRKLMLIAPLALAGLALFVGAGGLVVELLWNALLPPLFGWQAITFWQALGLLLLCRILFGGSGFHGPGRRGFGFRHASPEERERFRERLRARCGFGPGSAPDGAPPAAP